MNNQPYRKYCYNCCGMQQQSCMYCPQGPQYPGCPPGQPTRTVCVQLQTLFTTQTISIANTAELSFITVTPPGTYVAPFTVQSIASINTIVYNVLNFSITPPITPDGPSVIAMTVEVPIEIRAVDAGATPFAISGRAFVPISVSMVLPPNFNARDVQILVTLEEASATITSLTEISLTAEYILCFNVFQPEMVSLQTGSAACACNGSPILIGAV